MTKAKRKQQLINDAWASYQNTCVPRHTNRRVVEELRQSFFSGAAVLFTALLRQVSPGDEVAPPDLALMQSLQDEIDEFGQKLDRKILGPKH